MGFLNKLKSVNNSWGYVTYLSDGSLGRIFGRIGPKNMIDNRSQELMITSGTMNGPLKDEIVFAAKDVVRATVLQATSEWVKYRLELNSGLVAIVVMTVMDLPTGKAQGNKTTTNANFNDAWLNFEAWLGEALEREYDVTPCKYITENAHNERINNSAHQNEKLSSSSSPKKESSIDKHQRTIQSENKVKKVIEQPHKKKEQPKLGSFGITIGEAKKDKSSENKKQEDFPTNDEYNSNFVEIKEEYLDVTCPNCQETLSFMDFEKDEEVECPFCNFKFKLL